MDEANKREFSWILKEKKMVSVKFAVLHFHQKLKQLFFLEGFY